MAELHLEKRDPARNQLRFYRLVLAPTLFGEWSVMREWGRIGSPGRLRIDVFEGLDDAAALIERKVREKERRGYASAARPEAEGDAGPGAEGMIDARGINTYIIRIGGRHGEEADNYG